MARSARIISAGLSLLELLIALVIIALLITLLIPAYSATRARAQRAQCTANLRSLTWVRTSTSHRMEAGRKSRWSPVLTRRDRILRRPGLPR